ncbi:MAG: hypothetical protein [Caudoviricetes sp.]|nr:MAG: hypothetical protein [Caudoviricetes sp.]
MFNNMNIVKELQQRGLSYTDAYYINCNVVGTDRVYLENCLQSDSTENIEFLKGILYQNGIEYIPKYNYVETVSDDDKMFNKGFTIKIPINDLNINDIKNILKNFSINGLIVGNYFYIKCPDETASFVIDTNINSLNKEKLEEHKMSKNKRSIDQLKTKIANVRPRDPNHQLVNSMNINKGGFMNQGKTKRKDTQGRDAKHKKDFRDHDSFSLSSSKNINEGKLGFSEMESIGMQNKFIDFNRLKELSGIRESDISLPISYDTNDDVTDITDNGYDDTVVDSDIDINTDGELDNSVITATQVPVSNSDAMCSIMDYLNSIQTLLPDIKLAEYKTLIIKVNDLNDQLKTMGASYLGERRRK